MRRLCGLYVGEGAWLSYLPRALVPHADADYHGQTVVTLQAEARVLIGESLAPGRVLFGETVCVSAGCGWTWMCGSAGRLVARERALIRPDPVVRPAQFGPAQHTAGVYQLGAGSPPHEWMSSSAGLGCSPLAADGWYFRAAAGRAAELDQHLDRLAQHWWCA